MSTTETPATPTSTAGPKRRMRSPDRRVHLLDVATRLVVDDGPTNVTMERLAEAAGVSKALPYKHFDNIEAVFIAVYRREVEIMGTRIWQGLTEAGPDDDLVVVGVGIYFDELTRCGRVLSALSEPGAAIPALSSPSRCWVSSSSNRRSTCAVRCGSRRSRARMWPA